MHAHDLPLLAFHASEHATTPNTKGGILPARHSLLYQHASADMSAKAAAQASRCSLCTYASTSSCFCNSKNLAADALVAGTSLATKQQPNPASNDLLDEDMGPLRRAPLSKIGQSRASLQGPAGITEGIVQFAGEREMWASFQDANLRKQKRLKALLAGGALLVSTYRVCISVTCEWYNALDVMQCAAAAVCCTTFKASSFHWQLKFSSFAWVMYRFTGAVVMLMLVVSHGCGCRWQLCFTEHFSNTKA